MTGCCVSWRTTNERSEADWVVAGFRGDNRSLGFARDDGEMELKQIDPIKREPVATQVARKLVEYLLSGAVEPGNRMPSERQLAEAFGVGRSAMREAIKAL